MLQLGHVGKTRCLVRTSVCITEAAKMCFLYCSEFSVFRSNISQGQVGCWNCPTKDTCGVLVSAAGCIPLAASPA